MPGFASLLGKLGGGGGGSQHPPIPSSYGATTSNESSAPTPAAPTTSSVKYDVYSRPIISSTSIDPSNNMPSSTDTRNILPSSSQTVPLDTTRIASTIPRGGGKEGETWVYPSPQMFYNALMRKGKLTNAPAGAAGAGGVSGGEGSNREETTTIVMTKEEDMASVVAMHNCMNEATWRRVLQWEEVLHPTISSNNINPSASEPPSASARVGPALSRFEGRPTDLSPKAFIKHYLLNHPLPFDRHDWTITRTNRDGSTQDVRYVIDYYHDDASASNDVGSGYPSLDGDVGPKGQVQSLLVDVRPAADSVHEIWGRLIGMPLARRGCGSIVECVLAGGGDCTSKDDVGNATKKSEFEPLPLFPSESLSRGLEESKQVWKSIQLDALMKKGVGAMDGKMQQHSSSTLEQEPQSNSSAVEGKEASAAAVEQLPKITPSDATNYASTYTQILSTCQESKKALQNCQSEEECEQAMVGMTVCAGQFMCPLQHSSLLDSLKLSTTTTANGSSSKDDEAAAEVRISTALDILSECVANYDARASMAKRAYPELFDKVSRGQK
ncbi:hypothetical protein ACHAWU_009350 [Discostella pseudostelligera]|uniref:Holocytochrome c-type synthase n=1 Tax=Discostella pseudostelligera TaxID=259834 RepID=A0ABD3N7B7_9STRA